MSTPWENPERVARLVLEMDTLAMSVRGGSVEVGAELTTAQAYQLLLASAELAGALAGALPEPVFPPTP